MLTINTRFHELLPPLCDDEYARLEASIQADGVRDPLVRWGHTIVDGHNRYEIAQRHGIAFQTVEKNFEDEDDACIWIIENQTGKRNLTIVQRTFQLGELYKLKKKKHGGGRNVEGHNQHTEKRSSPHNEDLTKTSERIAREQNVSRATIERAADFHTAVTDIAEQTGQSTKEILNLADKTSKQDVMRIAKMPELMKKEVVAKITIGEAKSVADAVRETKRAEVVAKLEDMATKEVKAAQGLYDVIVIDPPWNMKKIERDVAPEQVEFDYPTMTEEALSELAIPAANDCHLWLWTTHKFFPVALRLLDAWRFKYVCNFVWHKPGGFQPFGLPQYNCEFAIYARKGTPKFIDTKAFFTCFEAPRGKHSEKPEEFYEVVRRVTAGRRVDLFNRREIEGFDRWGNEAK